jgi:uncharacterized protein (TIGR03435 family)
MLFLVRSAFLLNLALLTALAQAAPSRPAFEVASVKPVTDDSLAGQKMKVDMMMQSIRPAGFMPVRGNSLSMHGQSLLSLIAAAYRVKTTQVSGPSWMADVLFDVDARIPEGVSAHLANEMLQALLEERFGLKLHRETREMSGYHLVVSKNGPKLTVSAPHAPATDAGSLEDAAKAAMPDMEKMMKKRMDAGAIGGNRRSAQGISAGELAAMVSELAQSPVVDMTGLHDRYDVVLETSPDRPDGPGTSIFETVDKLGLKLVAHKVPVDTVVVDKASKTPTAN